MEIVGQVAGIPVNFLIDSGAEVNTVDKETFDKLMDKSDMERSVINISQGSDKPLKACASEGQIDVIATFVASLYISEDRSQFMEKLYTIRNGRPLLGRNTAIRYRPPVV